MLSLTILILSSAITMAAELVNQSETIAITGDSITYGGYPLLMDAYLNMCDADAPVRVVPFGWPGDSLASFWGRKCGAQPVMASKPTVVTTLYGMNDSRYKQVNDNTIKWYKSGLQRMIDTYKSNGVKTIIIGSPTAVDTTTYKPRNGLDAAAFNQSLALLTEAARQIAEQNQCRFVDLHHLILEVMQKAKAMYGEDYHVMGADGVHPSSNGRLIIAYAFLKALGCTGDIATITVDMKKQTATATQGHRVIDFKDNTIQLQSSRYPFCFKGDPTSPNATSGIIACLPFNEQLNRYILVVQNTPSHARFKVTWGEHSKIYSTEQLAQGINLASEFLDNPFCKPFEKVYWFIVDKKCKWENRQYMHMLARLPAFHADFTKELATLKPDVQSDIRKLLQIDPDAGQSLDRLERTILQADSQYAAKVSEIVRPVDHTIRIDLIDHQ